MAKNRTRKLIAKDFSYEQGLEVIDESLEKELPEEINMDDLMQTLTDTGFKKATDLINESSKNVNNDFFNERVNTYQSKTTTSRKGKGLIDEDYLRNMISEEVHYIVSNLKKDLMYEISREIGNFLNNMMKSNVTKTKTKTTKKNK